MKHLVELGRGIAVIDYYMTQVEDWTELEKRYEELGKVDFELQTQGYPNGVKVYDTDQPSVYDYLKIADAIKAIQEIKGISTYYETTC